MIRAARCKMDNTYREALGETPGVTFQQYSPHVAPLLWAFAVRLDPALFPQGRNAVIAGMTERGIETRPGFVAPSLMPHIYNTRSSHTCEMLSRWVISLPSYPTLLREDIFSICDSLKNQMTIL